MLDFIYRKSNYQLQINEFNHIELLITWKITSHESLIMSESIIILPMVTNYLLYYDTSMTQHIFNYENFNFLKWLLWVNQNDVINFSHFKVNGEFWYNLMHFLCSCLSLLKNQKKIKLDRNLKFLFNLINYLILIDFSSMPFLFISIFCY